MARLGLRFRKESIMASETHALRGSCLCGAVAWEVLPPFKFFKYCHCRRCRKRSGAAHAANLLVDAAQLAWTRGEESVRRFELPEARAYCTGFCAHCGSALPWLTKNGRYAVIPAGGLDDAPDIQPDKNIYWDSRAPWYAQASELPCFAAEAAS
jgi:hypothetical protein